MGWRWRLCLLLSTLKLFSLFFFFFYVCFFPTRLSQRLVGTCPAAYITSWVQTTHSQSQQRREEVRPCSRRTQPASRHGICSPARAGGGCIRRQLERPGSGSAAVCERDAVDPLPAGGVCGQRVGVLQRGDRTHLHVLFPAVHPPVRMMW